MVGFAVLGLVVAVVLIVGLDQRRRRRELVAAAAAAMDSVQARDSTGVNGKKNGWFVYVTVRKEGRSNYVTTVGCELPNFPFELELRPQGLMQEREIVKGQAVDVAVGDPTFDAEWVIEGAPADVVRRVLTESIRDRWTALGPDELKQPSAHDLQLRARGIRENYWVERSIQIMADIAAAIEPAFAASDMEARSKAEVVGSPYRGEVREPDTTAERARELAELHAVRNRRAVAVGLRWFIVAVAILGGAVLLGIYGR
jgi:hypothetical protein